MLRCACNDKFCQDRKDILHSTKKVGGSMSITINTNLSSLLVQNSLKNSTMSLNQAIERMTTGFKINSAKDDAAGYAIAEKMDVKLSSYDIAKSNTEMGLSLLNTASSSMDILTTHLQRIRDLSEQAANGTYDTDSRMAIQAEIDQRLEEIDRIIATTEYNGIKLFEGGAVSPIATYAASSSGVTGSFISSVTQLTEDEAIAQGYTLIKTADDLRNISSSGKYILMNDIDLSGITWTGLSAFSGELNGNGYVIKKLTGEQGLFNGQLTGTVKNLGLENVNINGTYGHTGGLCFYLDRGSIINCYVTGSVTGASGGFAGGICALAGNPSYNDTHITDCYVNINISGSTVGGICGSNQYHGPIITNSFSKGSVTGISNVGGLIGGPGYDFSIFNSYSQCNVSGGSNVGGICGNAGGISISNTYFDTDIAGTTNPGTYNTSAGTITGVTTAELQALIDNGTLPKAIPPSTPNGGTGGITLQVGIDSSENSQITFDTAFSLGTLSVNAMSTASAHNALADIDEVLSRITTKQTEFGAIMNRLESVSQSLDVSIENITSSLSTIKDADISTESSRFIKSQILQQASATLLATANQTPSIALQLI